MITRQKIKLLFPTGARQNFLKKKKSISQVGESPLRFSRNLDRAPNLSQISRRSLSWAKLNGLNLSEECIRGSKTKENKKVVLGHDLLDNLATTVTTLATAHQTDTDQGFDVDDELSQ